MAGLDPRRFGVYADFDYARDKAYQVSVSFKVSVSVRVGVRIRVTSAPNAHSCEVCGGHGLGLRALEHGRVRGPGQVRLL